MGGLEIFYSLLSHKYQPIVEEAIRIFVGMCSYYFVVKDVFKTITKDIVSSVFAFTLDFLDNGRMNINGSKKIRANVFNPRSRTGTQRLQFIASSCLRNS